MKTENIKKAAPKSVSKKHVTKNDGIDNDNRIPNCWERVNNKPGQFTGAVAIKNYFVAGSKY